MMVVSLHSAPLRYLLPFLSAIKAILLAAVYKRKSLARGAYVDPTVHVLGWRSVRIGKNSIVSEGSWLNVNHREEDNPQILIEDNCLIGRRNFISSGSLVRLGSYCLTGPDCKFLGSDHIFEDPFEPYITTGATDNAIIDIGVNCWFGAGAVVLGSVKIGHGCVIGVNALVNFDVPPFCLVVGNPGRIIKRFHMETSKWESVKNYSDACFKFPAQAEYLQAMRKKHEMISLPKRASGKYMGDLP